MIQSQFDMGMLKLIALRASSAWGDRLWTFGAGVFVAKFDDSQFRLVGIYGFILCLTVVLFGPLLGQLIDRNKRLRTAMSFLLAQNLLTLIACGLIIFGPTWELLPYAIIGVSSLANLASVGSNIVLEKDWITVIAGGDSMKLSRLNSLFRTIDLLCLILSPLGVGLLFDYTSNRVTAIAIGLWNVISLLIELTLYNLVYREHPVLSVKKPSPTSSKDSSSDETSPCKSSWAYYFQSPLKYAGLSLALLYLTVLGFDNVTWAYCLSLGISDSILGLSTGISALIGVSGSLSFPLIRDCMGLYRTGVLGFCLLSVSLIPCVVSVWIPGSPFYLSSANESGFWSVGVFLSGVISARFGLWLTDLSISQIFQEEVHSEHRGTFNGIQSSFNNFMDIIKFILVINFPSKDLFGWLIIASYIAVSLGGIVFIAFYFAYLSKKDPVKEITAL